VPRRCRFEPWVRKILWRRKRQPILVFLPEKNLMDRGAWWATVLRVAKSWAWFSMRVHTHTHSVSGGRNTKRIILGGEKCSQTTLA